MNNAHTKLSLLATLITGLVACGGGGGGSTSSTAPGLVTGIGGTGITSIGTITGFGSIFVNGVEFETNNASIEIDDSAGSQSGLSVGMVVKIEGTVNDDGVTGDASIVLYDANLEGPIADTPIANADNNAISFTVLGVSVVVNAADTVFENTSFGALVQGDMVDISGFYDANGQLVATFIEKKSTTFTAGSTEVEAKGTITGLSGTSFTLSLASGASLSVDASGANLTDIPGGSLANGQFVEVKGTLASASATTVTASEIQFEDFNGDEDNISLEGLVTGFVSLSDFSVNGTPVDASNATLEPTTLSLADGVEVEVEGALVNGTLVATRVESRGGNIEVHATVSGTTTNQVTLTLGDGSLAFSLDNQTRMEDSIADLSPFTVSNISNGDFLEIEAYQDASGNLIASRIKRDKPDDVILQGNVDSITDAGGGAGSVTILGITFSTTTATEFADVNETPFSPKDAFFSAGVGGSPVDDLVKIQDDLSADGVADSVEFED